MKTCIILGSGQSGTSMVAGTLAGAGYFMGERLYRPRESNPRGFLESPGGAGPGTPCRRPQTTNDQVSTSSWRYADIPCDRA
jgi:hypothetical protein